MSLGEAEEKEARQAWALGGGGQLWVQSLWEIRHRIHHEGAPGSTLPSATLREAGLVLGMPVVGLPGQPMFRPIELRCDGHHFTHRCLPVRDIEAFCL